MNTAASLLDPSRALCKVAARSKKRALEIAASLLAESLSGMSSTEVFEAINSRERLGSTGLGYGMALPHGRVSGLSEPVAACLTLEQPVDFDAPDRQRVDVLYALLVPRNCSREHLQILASLAEMFNDADLRECLRAQTDETALIECLDQWNDGR